MIEKVKEWYSTFIGIVLMGFAVSGYYFDYPQHQSILTALSEFGIGLVLVFLDPKELAFQAWEMLKNKL